MEQFALFVCSVLCLSRNIVCTFATKTAQALQELANQFWLESTKPQDNLKKFKVFSDH